MLIQHLFEAVAQERALDIFVFDRAVKSFTDLFSDYDGNFKDATKRVGLLQVELQNVMHDLVKTHRTGWLKSFQSPPAVNIQMDRSGTKVFGEIGVSSKAVKIHLPFPVLQILLDGDEDFDRVRHLFATTVVHEFVHAAQMLKNTYANDIKAGANRAGDFSNVESDKYLAAPHELEAYAHTIAFDLIKVLRNVPAVMRATMMTTILGNRQLMAAKSQSYERYLDHASKGTLHTLDAMIGRLLQNYFTSDRITESAETDIIAHKSASEIQSALIRHFMRGDPNNHYGLAGTRFSDGTTVLTLRGKDIGLTGDEARIWFWFAKFDMRKGGYFSRLKSSGDPVICISQFHNLEDTEEVSKKIIYDQKIHSIILHELRHYFDSLRDKTMLTPKINRAHGGPDYSNAPAEFNAYYHNFAFPLLNFLRIAKEDERNNTSALRRMADRMGIADDFQTTLTMLEKRAESNHAVKAFYRDLSPRNRKALLKRLYGLHQEIIMHILDQPEDTEEKE